MIAHDILGSSTGGLLFSTGVQNSVRDRIGAVVLDPERIGGHRLTIRPVEVSSMAVAGAVKAVLAGVPGVISIHAR
jgi:hypothetical protein